GKPITNQNGEIEKIEIQLETPKVFFANVFNGEQIENMPTLEIKPQISEFKAIQTAENILKNSGANIIHKGNNAYYQPNSDTITLPPKESFLSESAYYATALHELGHWSGHESRLNRDLSHPFGSIGYA
ncbi:hypothetical protein CFT13S00388_09720, partial [Campylobacter fetus subsp. testudinum]|uniref:zincin-like metallopeptidase domain-containing protein n=1 Tax=Campylobacter fetus TaxID=196 RepID=UPI0008280AF3